MRAVLCHSFTGPEDLRVGEIEAPKPAGDEVLIDVHAASVSFMDQLLVSGLYQMRPQTPFVPGTEAAGIIVAAGEEVTKFKPGDRVACSSWIGGYAERMIAKESKSGDGLRIFAGPLGRHSHKATAVLAATWTPDPNLTAEDGLVAPEFLWSALDCPTGYACNYIQQSGSYDQAPILLGRMSARIKARPRPGERCVITAWPTGRDGRKRVAGAAAHDEAGTLLAVARATWIVVERDVQLGRAS
ncbi:alcohol dehydrogenase catalytic domain-containing protein [Bradyrhizobium sp. 186]|uniref:alcohol dehydrogenase catalytic domain-containing protein n=1 Tax=Bradyrhizobium sp. 186 TaxID=2782654 RepID=UPI002000843C|nr:alcohol dehydrogenase catalytic domain-containing protein [Bradyrhizobium sp. 186]